MVEFIREESMTFKITNNDVMDEVGIFMDIIKKCNAEASKKGFRSLFSSDEKIFIKELHKKIIGDEVNN